MKLLLLADNATVRRLVELSAAKVGVEVLEFAPGTLPKTPVDFIVVEMEMLSDTLEADLVRFTTARKVLIMPRDAQKIAGFDFFIKKPFLPTELVDLFTRNAPVQSDAWSAPAATSQSDAADELGEIELQDSLDDVADLSTLYTPDEEDKVLTDGNMSGDTAPIGFEETVAESCDLPNLDEMLAMTAPAAESESPVFETIQTDNFSLDDEVKADVAPVEEESFAWDEPTAEEGVAASFDETATAEFSWDDDPFASAGPALEETAPEAFGTEESFNWESDIASDVAAETEAPIVLDPGEVEEVKNLLEEEELPTADFDSSFETEEFGAESFGISDAEVAFDDSMPVEEFAVAKEEDMSDAALSAANDAMSDESDLDTLSELELALALGEEIKTPAAEPVVDDEAFVADEAEMSFEEDAFGDTSGFVEEFAADEPDLNKVTEAIKEELGVRLNEMIAALPSGKLREVLNGMQLTISIALPKES